MEKGIVTLVTLEKGIVTTAAKIEKKIKQVKNWSPCEDWSRSCPFCGVDGSGLKNVQLVDCHSSSGSASTHPQSTQIFNEDQIVLSWTQFLLPTSEKLWNLLSLKRFREKLTSFCEMPKQLLLDFEETDFVQLNAPSPQPSCPRPVQGRMNENRTFSGSHARQQVVYEGEKLQSVWPGKARRRTTSGHICDKCSQPFKWVRWHILLGGVLRQRPTSVVRSFYPPTNICPEAFLLDSIDFLHICFTSHFSKFYSLTNSFYQATQISGQNNYNFLQSFCICLYKVSV